MAALERGWGEGPPLCPPPRGLGPAAHPLRQGGPPPRPLRRKRPMAPEPRPQEEEEGCPAGKRRRGGRAAGLSPQWPLCAAAAAAPEGPCEEMEQAAGEQQQQGEAAARRKLREIEDRITDEDEEGPEEGPPGHLPTLVLSDTLKTGLKRDYAGDLTKKIVESMSRPSMELVVWKPLPEFLTKKAKSVSAKNYKPVAERCPAKPATLEGAFSLQAGKFSEPQQTEMPSAFYCAVEPAGGSEEEMEL